MVRGFHRFVSAFAGGLHSWAGVRMLRRRHGGHEMRGPGWHGFAAGASRTEAETIQHSCALVFPEVEELIRADFDLARPLRGKLFIVHILDTDGIEDVAQMLCPSDDRPRGVVWGRYIPGVKSVVISQAPGSAEFCETAAHEICHGLSETALGAVASIPWSSEGYANFVALRVLRTLYPAARHRAHIATFRVFLNEGMDVSLRRMLRFQDQDISIPSHYLGCFQSHATLFIQFLDHRASEDDGIGECYRAAVREDPSSCMHHLLALEAAFGKSIEGIDEEFREFCSKL